MDFRSAVASAVVLAFAVATAETSSSIIMVKRRGSASVPSPTSVAIDPQTWSPRGGSVASSTLVDSERRSCRFSIGIIDCISHEAMGPPSYASRAIERAIISALKMDNDDEDDDNDSGMQVHNGDRERKMNCASSLYFSDFENVRRYNGDDDTVMSEVAGASCDAIVVVLPHVSTFDEDEDEKENKDDTKYDNKDNAERRPQIPPLLMSTLSGICRRRSRLRGLHDATGSSLMVFLRPMSHNCSPRTLEKISRNLFQEVSSVVGDDDDNQSVVLRCIPFRKDHHQGGGSDEMPVSPFVDFLEAAKAAAADVMNTQRYSKKVNQCAEMMDAVDRVPNGQFRELVKGAYRAIWGKRPNTPRNEMTINEMTVANLMLRKKYVLSSQKNTIDAEEISVTANHDNIKETIYQTEKIEREEKFQEMEHDYEDRGLTPDEESCTPEEEGWVSIEEEEPMVPVAPSMASFKTPETVSKMMVTAGHGHVVSIDKDAEISPLEDTMMMKGEDDIICGYDLHVISEAHNIHAVMPLPVPSKIEREEVLPLPSTVPAGIKDSPKTTMDFAAIEALQVGLSKVRALEDRMDDAMLEGRVPVLEFGVEAENILDEAAKRFDDIMSEIREKQLIEEEIVQEGKNAMLFQLAGESGIHGIFTQQLAALREYFGRYYETALDAHPPEEDGDEARRQRRLVEAAHAATEGFRVAATRCVPHPCQLGGRLQEAGGGFEYVEEMQGLLEDMAGTSAMRDDTGSNWVAAESAVERGEEEEQDGKWIGSGSNVPRWKKILSKAVMLGVNYLQGALALRTIRKAAADRDKDMPKFPLF